MNLVSKSIKLSLIAASLSLSLAACGSAGEECNSDSCESFDKADDNSRPGLKDLQIEMVGDGVIFVNEESCTTADGICDYEFPRGTDVTIKGDFVFVDDSGQEQECNTREGCQFSLDHHTHVIAELPEPQLPDIIVDDFISGRPRFSGLQNNGGGAMAN